MPERKTAIVTGASSGIGRATCLLLAAAGFDLALVARRRAKLAATLAMVRRQTPVAKCLVLPTDLCDDTAARAAVGTTVEFFGRLDALANVAGTAPLMPIEEATADVWRQCVDANLSYVIALTAAAWPTFRRQKSGVIVNVSSMASIDPFEGLAIYAAAKAGLNMFTLCTAREGERIGVRAAAVAPGAVETPMLRSLFGTEVIPPEKALAPEAVAVVIVDCITGKRDFKPGETIVVPSP